MNNWQVGDRAIIVDDGHIDEPHNRKVIGEECIIIGRSYTGHHDWEVGVCGAVFDAKSCCLRPIPDDKHKRFHEGLVSTKRSKCEWHPTKVTV